MLTVALSSGAVAAAGEQPSARSWIWAVVAGLVLSLALLGHAAWRAFAALPEPVRLATMSTLRRHPRLVAVQLGVALWTVVLALYNLAYPNSFLASPVSQQRSVSQGQPSYAVTPAPVEVPVPHAVTPLPGVVPIPVGAASPQVAPWTSPATPTSDSPPEPTSRPTPTTTPAPCEVQSVTDVLRTLDGPATTVAGRPLGSEAAQVVEGAAGCRSVPIAWAPPAVGAAEWCGNVLIDLDVLRLLAPLARLGTASVDGAIASLTPVCHTLWRSTS